VIIPLPWLTLLTLTPPPSRSPSLVSPFGYTVQKLLLIAAVSPGPPFSSPVFALGLTWSPHSSPPECRIFCCSLCMWTISCSLLAPPEPLLLLGADNPGCHRMFFPPPRLFTFPEISLLLRLEALPPWIRLPLSSFSFFYDLFAPRFLPPPSQRGKHVKCSSPCFPRRRRSDSFLAIASPSGGLLDTPRVLSFPMAGQIIFGVFICKRKGTACRATRFRICNPFFISFFLSSLPPSPCCCRFPPGPP